MILLRDMQKEMRGLYIYNGTTVLDQQISGQLLLSGSASGEGGGYGYGCLDPESRGGGYVNLDSTTQHAIVITSKIAGPM